MLSVIEKNQIGKGAWEGYAEVACRSKTYLWISVLICKLHTRSPTVPLSPVFIRRISMVLRSLRDLKSEG